MVVWVGESFFEYLFQLKWRNLAQDLQHDPRLDTPYGHVRSWRWVLREPAHRQPDVHPERDINQMERFLNGGANQIIQVILLVGDGQRRVLRCGSLPSH